MHGLTVDACPKTDCWWVCAVGLAPGTLVPSTLLSPRHVARTRAAVRPRSAGSMKAPRRALLKPARTAAASARFPTVDTSSHGRLGHSSGMRAAYVAGDGPATVFLPGSLFIARISLLTAGLADPVRRWPFGS